MQHSQSEQHKHGEQTGLEGAADASDPQPLTSMDVCFLLLFTLAGKPKASTRCSESDPPSFDRPQIFQCDQTLSDILQNLTSADLETLAASTQILTSKPEELTAEDVTTAAQIANTLLLSPNTTESVRVAAVATVSQLLNVDSSEENNATLGLTMTLDQLSLSLSSAQPQVVQPNLAVQSAQMPAADTQGVQFTSLSGTSGSLVADRIQLNTNTSAVVLENGFLADALIYVGLPAEAASGRQEPANVSLGFVLYQNNRFFRSKHHRQHRATFRVLSASVRGYEAPLHLEMLFRPAVMNGTSLYDFACVFWNYSLNEWSTDGCSKGNASDGLLRCFCNHTTNFAALWSFKEKYEYAEALDVFSIVGLSLSILGLVITIIQQIRDNFQRGGSEQNRNIDTALLSVSISLLAFIITFLSGAENSSSQSDAPVEVGAQTNANLDSDEYVEPDRGSCSVVAALLHFFLLATFTWNSIISTQLFLLVRNKRLPSHCMTVSQAVGWGVPAVVMGITLGVSYRVDSPLGYRQEEFCWLAALDKNKRFHFGRPMFWGFLLPVGLILLYNIFLLGWICRIDEDLRSTKGFLWTLRNRFPHNFSLLVSLVVSWTLGYLVLVTTGPAHLVLSILFCLCTTTQGLQIFLLFTLKKPTFRKDVSRSLRSVTELNMTNYNLWKKYKKVSESTTDLTGRYWSSTDPPEPPTESDWF
ncbi:adhesion G-protein coupled receptor G7 [Pempheris klunzingeri]|uniref:adhesion G-protein coupled receptor G7 n=1 Tax=Pempheris klunzingeri TaxID=3127111 RepID=UPI00397FE5A0